MLGAIRRGDFVIKTCKFKSSGPFYTASNSTFVDGRGQVTVGHKALPGMCITGSKSVFVEGKPAAHKMSKVICGKILTCSSTVFIGA
jgi:uncharacterized Zn-binding protein involved in type VI secretion